MGGKMYMPTSRPTILVVDDEHRLGRFVTMALQRAGYDAYSCTSVAEARTLLARGGWSLVIADIFMPQETGFELASWIRQQCPWVPTVLVTAHSTEAVVHCANQLGVTTVLHKPFTIEQLRNTVHELLPFPEAASARWTGRIAAYQ
jgi:two-component system response regulator HydG